MQPETVERLYRESQSAICDLISAKNEHTPVPACPLWTLHDLLAHQTGAMQDFLSGNTDGAPGEAWTAAQVERFRDTDIEELKSIWKTATDQAAPLFRGMGANLLPDVVTHEFDVRGALGNTDRRDAEGLPSILTTIQQWKQGYFQQHDLPAIEVIADGHRIVFGEGEPQITLRTSLYEASRVFAGRRSFNQIRALDWSADSEPWLQHLSVLGKPEQDVMEG